MKNCKPIFIVHSYKKLFLTNGGCFSPCSFLFIIKSSSHSLAFLPSQSYMGNSAQSLSWVHFFFYCRYTVNEIVRVPSFQPPLLSLFFVSLRNYYGWFPKTIRIFLKASHLKDRKFILEKCFRGLRPLPLGPFTLNFCLGRAS